MTNPCPSCHAGDGRPRSGTLGVTTGELWCSQCGHIWAPPSAAPTVYLSVATKTPETPPHYIHQINAVSGDDLDYAAVKFFGMFREVTDVQSSTFENDEEFRARILREVT